VRNNNIDAMHNATLIFMDHGIVYGALYEIVSTMNCEYVVVNTPFSPYYISHYWYISRYARWSLGFVDPPLEVSGTGNHCKISALNTRGQVLLEPVLDAMNKLLASGTVSEVVQAGDVIDVHVPPPAEVGSFSEEERSRQVRLCGIHSFALL
jgi:hypothetical protein